MTSGNATRPTTPKVNGPQIDQLGGKIDSANIPLQRQVQAATFARELTASLFDSGRGRPRRRDYLTSLDQIALAASARRYAMRRRSWTLR
jgi:hypothetical protein